MGIETNADDVADTVAQKRAGISRAVASGTRSALLAIESEAVKNLSGDGAPFSYPVPVRTGNLRRDRTVQQPEPGIGILAFLASYAWAVHEGEVGEYEGRGKTKIVQRSPRPFAQDAVDKVDPAHFILEAVDGVISS